MTVTKRAVVLFNLGGPDDPASVRPFLFNLFKDPSIIGLPYPARLPLAWFISTRRAPVAREIYNHIGGGSPLRPNTEAQAAALEDALGGRDEGWHVFVCMRYWHPMAEQVARSVAAIEPDEVILLPLYPQFSTTTTASSARVWKAAAKAAGLDAPTRLVCCYPLDQGFVSYSADAVTDAWQRASPYGTPRVLFSAHGVPERVISGRGDPYQWQCEQCVAAIVAAMGMEDLDWVACYQSRVGPLKWIGPSTDEEIERAGRDGVPVVIYPYAFVSEHSETLVEVEIEYRELAEKHGVPHFERVDTVMTDAGFIDSLAARVQAAVDRAGGCPGKAGGRVCPKRFKGCPNPAAAPT